MGKDPLRLISSHLPLQEHFALHGSILCFYLSSGPFLAHSTYPTFFHLLQTMPLAPHTPLHHYLDPSSPQHFPVVCSHIPFMLRLSTGWLQAHHSTSTMTCMWKLQPVGTFTLTQLTSQLSWTKLTDHSPLLVALLLVLRFLVFLPCPRTLSQASWFFFLNQSFNVGTCLLITKGKQ